MEPTELLGRLQQVFPTQPMPGMTLRQAQLADQSLSRDISEAEWEAEGLRDRAHAWTEVTDTTLAECNAALSHLDEQSFCYYLPAYLSFALRPNTKSGLQYEQAVVAAVHAVTELSAYNRSRLKYLTADQIDAVTEFVRWVHDTDSFHRPYCANALKNYWETPDARRRGLIEAP